MNEKEPLEVAIASPPNREFHVAQIFEKEDGAAVQIAEIIQDSGDLVIELYPDPDGLPTEIGYDRFMEALERGKERLVNFDPRESPFFKPSYFEES